MILVVNHSVITCSSIMKLVIQEPECYRVEFNCGYTLGAEWTEIWDRLGAKKAKGDATARHST